MSTPPDFPIFTTKSELEAAVRNVVSATLRDWHPAIPASFIRSRECAALLDITPEQLSAMRSRGEGPQWTGKGKWIRYDKANVLQWLSSLQTDPPIDDLQTPSRSSNTLKAMPES